MPDLLTVPEVAEYLRVPVNTLRYWLRKGRIPVRKISHKAVRITRTDLEAFIKKSRVVQG